jgi:hypothetical protein
MRSTGRPYATASARSPEAFMNFTLEAQTRLDEYLVDVRSAVTGHSSISPDGLNKTCVVRRHRGVSSR